MSFDLLCLYRTPVSAGNRMYGLTEYVYPGQFYIGFFKSVINTRTTFKPQIQWIWDFSVYIKNFLRQNGPNRIFRHWFLSFLSSQLLRFSAVFCRFLAVFAGIISYFVLAFSRAAARKIASAKPFLRLQMAEWWQKWWQKFGRQISSKPARRKAFSDCVHSKSEKSPLL